jgi:hypothetical protein
MKTAASDDLEKFLAGTTDAFTRPPVNRNRRPRDSVGIALMVGSALSVVAVVGLGLLGAATVGIIEWKHAATMPASVPPGIAVEAPGRTKASDPSPTTAPTVTPAVAPQPPTVEAINTLDPSSLPRGPNATRATMALWWLSRPVTKPHTPPRRNRHPGPAATDSLQTFHAPPPGDFGCPPSLGVACPASRQPRE